MCNTCIYAIELVAVIKSFHLKQYHKNKLFSADDHILTENAEERWTELYKNISTV